jgi:PEP-CTERM motif
LQKAKNTCRCPRQLLISFPKLQCRAGIGLADSSRSLNNLKNWEPAMKRLSILLMISVAALQVNSNVHAGTIIDQSNTADQVTGYYAPSLPNLIGESFTATATSMNWAEFYTNYNSDFQIGVQVEVLKGAGLGGNVLGTSDNVTFARPTQAPWANPPYTNARPVEFLFSTPITLVAGQQYTLAVLVPVPTPSSQNYFSVGTTGSNTYAGGDRYSSVNGTGPLSDDLWFAEGMTSTVPEPSSFALLGLGGIALTLAARQKGRMSVS